MGYLPVKMQMNTMACQLRHMMRVQTDWASRRHCMDFAVSRGTQWRARLVEPVALGQVAVQHISWLAQRQARNDGIEPVAHFGAREDLPVRTLMQVDQLRPHSLFQANERPLLEMPDEWNAAGCH